MKITIVNQYIKLKKYDTIKKKKKFKKDKQ
jgi:hypothetical protein